jgi:hypothetical protein
VDTAVGQLVSAQATRLLADEAVGVARVRQIVAGIDDHPKQVYKMVEEIIQEQLHPLGQKLGDGLRQHVSLQTNINI